MADSVEVYRKDITSEGIHYNLPNADVVLTFVIPKKQIIEFYLFKDYFILIFGFNIFKRDKTLIVQFNNNYFTFKSEGANSFIKQIDYNCSMDIFIQTLFVYNDNKQILFQYRKLKQNVLIKSDLIKLLKNRGI